MYDAPEDSGMVTNIREESFHGRLVYRLAAGIMEIVVDPWHGMSVVSLLCQGREFLWYDEQRYLAGNTYGIAVLFPTPNRIRDGVFRFDDELCGPSRMHGFAKDVPFAVEAVECGTNGARIVGRYRLEANAAVFREFPFPLELVLSISIAGDRVQWDYTVRNTGSVRLGYGFALHPFFVRQDGTSVCLDASQIMEAGQDKLPSGTLCTVEGTKYDLRQGSTIAELSGLDTVYCASHGDSNCQALFGESCMGLAMHTSEEFRHFVVYVPENAPFFCVEPQTCSPDCHNLYDEGLHEVANLLLVAPGAERKGRVEMVFSAV